MTSSTNVNAVTIDVGGNKLEDRNQIPSQLTPGFFQFYCRLACNYFEIRRFTMSVLTLAPFGGACNMFAT